jgi:hypothetical protein
MNNKINVILKIFNILEEFVAVDVNWQADPTFVHFLSVNSL